jgi:tetratricopeptide (TPR) repeat protein
MGFCRRLGNSSAPSPEGKRAVELDPLSLVINTDLGQDFFYARRYDEAIAHLRKTIEMDPRFYFAHWVLGTALQLKGQLSDALPNIARQSSSTTIHPFSRCLGRRTRGQDSGMKRKKSWCA